MIDCLFRRKKKYANDVRKVRNGMKRREEEKVCSDYDGQEAKVPEFYPVDLCVNKYSEFR
jgi:hypothetical protein